MLLTAQYVFPITSEPIADGAVYVYDGKIADIGKADMLKLRYPDEEVRDFGSAAIMPGLVDLFACLESAVLHGIISDIPYSQWVVEVLRRESMFEPADWQHSALLGGLEALSSGITTIADMSNNGAACNIMQQLGLRGIVYRSLSAMDKSRIDYGMKMAERDIAVWREAVDLSRISIGIAPAAVYFNHPEVYRRVSYFATVENLPVAMRMASSREEYNFVSHGSSMFSVDTMVYASRGYVEIPPWLPTGVSPVQYAANWGAFDAPNVMVIHAVHVDEDDIKTLKEQNVSIAICPRANAQLGMGTAPLNAFLRADISTGIGTDSPAATDAPDMFSEMRLGMLLQRVSDTRNFLPAAKMLELATLGGARALHMEDTIGSLDVGKLADIIAVDLSNTHQSSDFNPMATVVNTCSASDVLMTMVGGNVLYEKNHWHVDVDVAKNIAQVIEIRSKLRN